MESEDGPSLQVSALRNKPTVLKIKYFMMIQLLRFEELHLNHLDVKVNLNLKLQRFFKTHFPRSHRYHAGLVLLGRSFHQHFDFQEYPEPTSIISTAFYSFA